jgi:peptide/nickel transport system substrate-binding protein
MNFHIFGPSPTHRRRAVVSVAGVLAASVALAGCSASSGESGESGGTSDGPAAVSMGITSSPTSLDPNVASGANDALVMRQIFDSLVVENEDHEFEPWLADSWDISEDGTSYTFHLKEGVKFQDGTDFDAEAVKTNIDRILDPETASQFAASLLGPTESATVIDEHTVELTLESRYGPLLSGLSQAFLGIQSPAAIEEYGTDVANHPVGTGAFAFESWTADQEVVLTANKDYTSPPATADRTGASDIDELTFTIVPETSSRVGALQSGELTAALNIPAEQLTSLQSDDSLAVTVAPLPGASYSLYYNLLNAPWDDVEARKALRLGLDIDSIVEAVYFGNYPRAWSVLSPATDAYDESLEDAWSYDPDAAVAAFEALGYEMNGDGLLEKDGEALTLRMVNQSPDYDKRLAIDEILQQQLADIGVTLETSALEFPEYAAATQGGEYELESFSITTGSPSVLYTIFASANQPNAEQFLYNVAHYTAPEMDEWGEAAAAAATTDEANGYYEQIQQKVIDEAVAIPVYVNVQTFATQASLTGVTLDTLGYPSFYGASF